jgi:ferric-dicitrate binding protein FerR (iron transport regulator)
MAKQLRVEELTIDDSFINYCMAKNDEDVLYWTQYIDAHPEETATIDEARNLVVALKLMLKEEYSFQTNDEERNAEMAELLQTNNVKSLFRYRHVLGYAASIIALVAMVWLAGRYIGNKGPERRRELAEEYTPDNTKNIVSDKGERKCVLLPDNTRMYLNAGSKLLLAKGFGKDNRSVFLEGEAMFDVTHNAALPFVVHVKDYDIKVLGTTFNVRAYAGEQSEATLLKGKIELTVKRNGEKIILKPNQKFIISNPTVEASTTPTKISLDSLSYDKKNIVVETAWTQNTFEINNETFTQFAGRMERWYKVKINFADTVVKTYPFTAIYDRESIDEVLRSLQLSYHFNYKINGSDISISK